MPDAVHSSRNGQFEHLRRLSRGAELALALSLAFLFPCSGARAQEPPAAPDAAPREQLDKNQFQLRGVEQQLQEGAEEKRRLDADLEAARNDRARLSAALIETTGRERADETRVADVTSRLETAQASEQAIRRSLESRRDTIANVLAALQRMGRSPPPAVLADPQDILKAVRAAMLLGAVVPELRAEANSLLGDLEDLQRATTVVAEERRNLAEEIKSLAAERERLAGLVAERQAAMERARQALDAQELRMRELARRGADLKELIARSELDVAAAARAADAARRADGAGARVAMATPPDPARLAPAVAFADAKGAMPQPVNGTIVKNFGDLDSFGAAERGVSFATLSNAVVTAPCDGSIVYSGPWRTFGQLLIINAGGGYYVVLAGMRQVDVNVGQFVLSGEPIASMGDGAAMNAVNVSIGAGRPVLYVEFRKDGVAIDPGPWWAKSDLEKVRG